MLLLPLLTILLLDTHATGNARTDIASCLRYRPDTVQISGQLHRHTFYGQPGFGEDPQHDARETGFYLDLTTPVCTARGQRADSDAPVSNVHRIHLVLDSAGYARLRPSLGRQVTLRGTLFAAFTGHHHAPLLLDVLTPLSAPSPASERSPGTRHRS